MAEAYYEPTPATDGATMNPVPGAVFQVFEIADTTFTTPLSLRVGSGNPTTTVAASDTLATLPGVYVTSPNFEHIWVSGTFQWRRDSIDGAKGAIERAESSALSAANAAADAERESATSAQAAQDAAALVDAPADTVMRDVAANPNSAFAGQLSATYGGKKRQDAPTKQAYMLGQAMQKLRAGTATTICAMGDSTVYGSDFTSSDKVAATGTTSNGVPHTASKSPFPWPEVMGTRLTEAYAGTVSIINRGYSGETADTAYTHWNTDHSADLTIINLGSNDSRGGRPTDGNIKVFVEQMEALILREIIDYSSPVVLMTPIRQRDRAGDQRVDAYRAAIRYLGGVFGIPVLDGENMLSQYGADCYSDEIHLNTKGNSVLATRMAAALMSESPDKPVRVGDGTRLSVRPTQDGVLLDGAVLADTSVGTVTESGTSGISISLNGGTAYYSFYTEQADLIAVPAFVALNTVTVDISLDFGVPQPDNLMDEWLGLTASASNREPSFINYVASGTVRNNVETLTGSSVGLRIASPGWHTLKITGSAGGSILLGLEFMSWRRLRAKPASAAVTLGGTWVNYGTPLSDLQTHRQLDGTVTLNGAIKSGGVTAGTTLGTVAVGHRPAARVVFPASNPTAPAGTAQVPLLYVEPTGLIKNYTDIVSNGLLAMNATYPAA